MANTSELVLKECVDRPGFTTEELELDVESTRAIVHETLGSISATDSAEGLLFRTMDGSLIAVLAPADDEGSTVSLHYRTTPLSEPATLKARRLWRALEPYSK